MAVGDEQQRSLMLCLIEVAIVFEKLFRSINLFELIYELSRIRMSILMSSLAVLCNITSMENGNVLLLTILFQNYSEVSEAYFFDRERVSRTVLQVGKFLF